MLFRVLGITPENLVAFKMTDQILVFYMVDISLVLLKLAVIYGLFDIPELNG